MWAVTMEFAKGQRSITLTPPMSEEDAYTVLAVLRQYPQPGVEYGLRAEV